MTLRAADREAVWPVPRRASFSPRMSHFASPAGGSAGAPPPVSLVVVNARVWTGNPDRPWADAVAVRGDRLAAVGSSAGIRKLAPPTARMVDARGGLLVAGDGDPARSGGPLAATAVLVTGGAADFTLFDRDISRLSPDAIHQAGIAQAGIVLRVVGGEVISDRRP